MAIEETRRRELHALRIRRKLPQRRLILCLLALAVLTCSVFLFFFWIPSQSLVDDLRSRGIVAAAEVTDSPKDRFGSAGNVMVRFEGPDGPLREALSEWGGKRPEGLPQGSVVRVVYDPHDPSRVLTQKWVDSPPTLTLPMVVCLVLCPLFLAGAIALTLRRRTLLRLIDSTS
ncbi:hypothetical protein OYE22_20125 [Streptomyces sp. 71268]|uniref:DUF3592 domain-containing protein n=1 Tax=Streptomyces sp. 71268 TaxID=3002640 RepID=UPI0023F80998|nr:DUF3592 domain-containing protein [Streptomyces sp. 71268]WEV27250.1 hypothetical protein OYE22_20125 [Streptomyces sp. 71268]